MNSLSSEQKIYYTLLLAVAMCFIGHGAFGIITKPVWVNYFAVFGIGRDMAYRLMPFVGIFDIMLGVAVLLYPSRAIVGWLVIWGLLTALLRPLSGEPVAETVERAGNYGAPLALLILTWPRSGNVSWLAAVRPSFAVEPRTWRNVKICLRIVVFLLLAGHGWLNLLEKKGLLDQYTSIGFDNPAAVARFVGIFEVAAALFVLVRPLAPVLMFLLLWKMATEMFYPHYVWFEWIERGGSYASILALWFALRATASVHTHSSERKPQGGQNFRLADSR